MKATDTFLLGHVSAKSLIASSYSDLWTSSTGVLISGGVLGTFCSQAFGAQNFDLVGIWLQVSFAVLIPIMGVVAILWCLTGILFQVFHAPTDIIPKASYYATVLATCLPAQVGLNQLSQFFASQRVTKPMVICSALAMIANMGMGLMFVLGRFIPDFEGFGFKACPAITAGCAWLQLLLLLGIFCGWQKLHMRCWPGWSWKHLKGNRIKQYVKMYVPAALSIASDFWRFAVIGVVAQAMGQDKLAVFNSSYRILWICLTFISSTAQAVSIKVGNALGKNQPETAKRSVAVGTTIASVLLCVLGLVVYACPQQLALIFSNDKEIIDLFVSIRLPLALMMVVMNLAVFLEAIPRALGRTKKVLYMGLIGSWVGQVPGVLLCTTLWRNDLVGLYTGASCGYLLLCMLFAWIIGRIDWSREALKALQRSEALLHASSDQANDANMEGIRKDLVDCQNKVKSLMMSFRKAFIHGRQVAGSMMRNKKNFPVLGLQRAIHGLAGIVGRRRQRAVEPSQ
eukprot:gnl/MRDRNA2_/MRDRNA2_166769_c0_seq1.p1 gnl/MRDRNA2_/MRDRNA2_166769_c0~~gnl/MRDRNA2_/MRDRNA2_166769_c0_seq1.p1  ORF type:complete len:578 (+),score=83.67 gnl/MRDRNA2_/MRDRNA2_166769_c0_seq1:201-1736(+)